MFPHDGVGGWMPKPMNEIAPVAAEVAGGEAHAETDHKRGERPKGPDEERYARTVKEPNDLTPSELVRSQPHPWLRAVRLLVVREDVLLREVAVEEVGGQ